MSTPQDSTAPVPILPSDPAYVANKTNAVRFSERVVAWLNGLSPSGATEYDTGWVDVTPTGVTVELQPQVRVVGSVAYWRGEISGSWTTAWNTVVAAGGVPAIARPKRSSRDTSSDIAGTGGTVLGRAIVEADGSLKIRATTSVTGLLALKGLSGYLVD